MKYPNKSKLQEIELKLKDTGGTRMVGPSSTPAEKFRWELCQSLVRYMFENKLLSYLEKLNPKVHYKIAL